MRNNEKPAIVCTKEMKEVLIYALSMGGESCDGLEKEGIKLFSCLRNKEYNSCDDCLRNEIDWIVCKDPKAFAIENETAGARA